MLLSFEALAVGAPRLDIDITLFVQMALFVALWVLVRSRLVKPYLAAKHERESLTVGAREEAAALKSRSDELLKRYQTVLAEAQLEASKLRSSLMNEGSESGQLRVQSAKLEASQRIEEQRKQVATELGHERASLEKGAQALSKVIADKLLPV